MLGLTVGPQPGDLVVSGHLPCVASASMMASPVTPASTRSEVLVTGRKLLLADDSITVQKVVDLTFADEGIEVFAVSDGEQALALLDTLTPDVVLADVFMPKIGGYEVCDYIKRHERLRHIPVMLLVGSFEPFDETEARRVGADDYLTKPFQSIRQLVQKVGALLGRAQPDESLTRELPQVSEPRQNAQEPVADSLEFTTADTRPLPALPKDASVPKVANLSEQSFADLSFDEEGSREPVVPEKHPESTPPAIMSTYDSFEEPFPSFSTEATEGASVSFNPHASTSSSFSHSAAADDALLDLGEMAPPQAAREADDFILDLRDEAEPLGAEYFVNPAVEELDTDNVELQYEAEIVESGAVSASHSSFDELELEDSVEQPWASREVVHADAIHLETDLPQEARAEQPVVIHNVNQISPEVIEAIARRVVELMSTSVIEQIAWEVVPQLSEALIKNQLQEQQTKTG
jgi:CheY-like chemotaxis protein